MTLTPLFDWTPLNAQKWLAWLSTLLNIANSCLGPGQTWQNMTGARAVDVLYTNTTSRPIVAEVTAQTPVESGNLFFEVAVYLNGSVLLIDVIPTFGGGQYYHAATIVIPPGATYQVFMSLASLYLWWELR